MLRVSFTNSYSSSLRLLMVLLVVAALPLGCAKVQPEPFAKFSASMQELRAGTDQASSVVGTWSLDRTTVELVSLSPNEAVTRISKFLINCDRVKGTFDPLACRSESEPLFIKVDRFRRGFYALNTALISYGTALQMLASPDLVDSKTFDKLRTDLNGNLIQAAKQFGVTSVMVGTEQFKVEGFALFTTISTEAGRGIIEQRRKNQLVRILKENQSQIAAVAALGYEGASNLGTELRNEYGLLAESLVYQSSGFSSNRTPSPSSNESSRRKAFDQLMALNKLFATNLEVIDALHRAYSTLPAAHTALSMDLESSTTGWAAMQDIFREGQRLFAIYNELAKANQVASK
ncbi:MAG: hypothetical protein ACLGSA_15145 [Acidobacteriota bacterium]